MAILIQILLFEEEGYYRTGCICGEKEPTVSTGCFKDYLIQISVLHLQITLF